MGLLYLYPDAKENSDIQVRCRVLVVWMNRCRKGLKADC
jgi:hypothetical protein